MWTNNLKNKQLFCVLYISFKIKTLNFIMQITFVLLQLLEKSYEGLKLTE